jgi:flagellar hook assembly protein FlgD
VRFSARLSNSLTWTVAVRDAGGAVVASGTGTGTRVDWTWDATAAPTGRYAWSITAPQMRAATGTIGTAPAPLSLQQLRVSPAIVSPNGDGRGDEAKVTYRLSTAAAVTATVQDVLDNPVASIFSGRRNAGKQELTWSPDSLNDGWYKLTLVASAGGKQVHTSSRFWVDRTLANVAASGPAFSPNGDGQLDTVGVSFRLLNPAHVEVHVLRRGQVLATLLAKDLPAGQQRLTWDGSRLPDGRYTLSVGAADSLLNVTQALPVRIDRKPPSLRLVSFSPLAFRVSEPGRLVVAVNGRWRRVTVKRAGLVRLGNRTPVRGVTAYAIDLAGNKSRVVRARR